MSEGFAKKVEQVITKMLRVIGDQEGEERDSNNRLIVEGLVSCEKIVVAW